MTENMQSAFDTGCVKANFGRSAAVIAMQSIALHVWDGVFCLGLECVKYSFECSATVLKQSYETQQNTMQCIYETLHNVLQCMEWN